MRQLHSLAEEGAVPAATVQRAIEKYGIDPEKPNPVTNLDDDAEMPGEPSVGVEKQVLLPDIGDFENVDVIEILVSVGDRVEVDDSLIVLESDKATMEIPSPFAGVVREICVVEGDQVSQGALIAIDGGGRGGAAIRDRRAARARVSQGDSSAPSEPAASQPAPSSSFGTISEPARNHPLPSRGRDARQGSPRQPLGAPPRPRARRRPPAGRGDRSQGADPQRGCPRAT